MKHLTNLVTGFNTGRAATMILTILIWMVLPFSLDAAIDTSYQSGDWGKASTWEDGSVPTASDSVVIRTEHTVEIYSVAECANVKIHEGGSGFSANNTYLAIWDSNELSVTNDVEIIGTGDENAVLYLANTSQADIDGDIIFRGTGTQAQVSLNSDNILNVAGDLILDSEGKIDGGTDSEIIFDGATSQSIDISTNTIFNDITINSSSIVTINGSLSSTELGGDLVVQNGTFSNGGYSISGDGSNNFEVQNGGNFLMTSTTDLPSSVNHIINTGATIEYGGGNQTVEAPNNSQNYYDLNISGTGTKSLGSAMTVDNNLTISSATLDANGNNLTVNGDWLNNGGSFTAGSASVTFSGGSQQEIKSNSESFNNVTFNNGSDFTLNGVMTVDGSCTMTDGVISTGNDTLVLKSTTASDLSGHSSASFVNGYLKRHIGSNTSTYDFPVGDGTQSSNYYLAEMINDNLSGITYIEASYINISDSEDDNIATEHISPDDTITYAQLVRTDGVWMLEPDNSPTGGDYNLKCHTDNYIQNSLEDNDIGIVKRALGSSNNGANWSAAGDINAKDGDGRLVADGYVLSKNIASFSEFGVGGGSSTTALPVELLSFNAEAKEEYVDLQWVTATETNNDYFSVQRSKDGQDFKTITKVEGNGTSTTKQNYTYNDGEPLKGTSYYRLKQVDKNGDYSYSNIATVTYSSSDMEIKVSPNPVQKGNSIQMEINQMNNEVRQPGKVKIYKAVTGQLVSEFELRNDKRSYKLPANVNNGVYLIKGSIGQDSFSRKLVIQ